MPDEGTEEGGIITVGGLWRGTDGGGGTERGCGGSGGAVTGMAAVDAVIFLVKFLLPIFPILLVFFATAAAA